MERIKNMVKDMETVETLLGMKGRFVGDMVHISIADLAQCARVKNSQLEAAVEGLNNVADGICDVPPEIEDDEIWEVAIAKRTLAKIKQIGDEPNV